MSYTLIVDKKIEAIIYKISQKDKLQYEILARKIQEVINNPYQKKPLRGNMAGQWRVHIRNFVLTYEINEATKEVILLDYDHHDSIYKK